MPRDLEKIKAALDKALGPNKVDTTIATWKILAGAFKGLAEMIEENGYYPNIRQKEAMRKWLLRILETELRGND